MSAEHTMADTYRLGVDVGGTFTDLLLINAKTSAITAKAKVPSTPKDPSVGVQVSENVRKERGVMVFF